MRLLVLWTLLFAASPAFANPLKVEGQGFRDEEGNQVLLRGVNVSGASKVPPFRAIRGTEDLAPLRGWGFNSIRLLFNWEAFEPTRGHYDESYLAYYRDVIHWAAEHNLYVIVDIHQDAFSRFTAGGCGDGFPEWALAPNIPRATPKNDESCTNWGITTVLNPDMHTAWKEFYKNTEGVRDHYLAMVGTLARAVAEEPNVIGLALLNEPWGDEKTELFELYRDASLRVREEFPDSILFLSGAAKTSTGIVASELPRIPGENLVHETHFYDPGIGLGRWSRWILELSNLSWKKTAKAWQAPVFIGEFGAPARLSDGEAYVETIYELLDREAYSGAYWVYTPTYNDETKDGWNLEDFSLNNAEGELRGPYRPRPWLEKISSQLYSMKWDKSGNTLTVEYEAKEDGSFELQVPEAYTFEKASAVFQTINCSPRDRYHLSCAYPKAWLLGRGKATLSFDLPPNAKFQAF